MHTVNLIFGSVCGVIFIGQFICIGTALHLSYTKGDIISSHFKNCSYLINTGIYNNSSFYGRILLMGNISSIVTFPKFFLKRGLVSAEEIGSFPRQLKRQLNILQWSFIGLLAAMVLLVTIGKSGILS